MPAIVDIMTRITLPLALLLTLCVTSAQALSCLRTDAVRLFEAARDAEAAFHIVKGRITLLEAAQTPDPAQKKPARTRARLTGTALSGGGFNARYDREITIEAVCLSIWCGSAEGLTEDMIFAVVATRTGPVLRIDPCATRLVRWTQAEEDRLLRCYRSGICETADF